MIDNSFTIKCNKCGNEIIIKTSNEWIDKDQQLIRVDGYYDEEVVISCKCGNESKTI